MIVFAVLTDRSGVTVRGGGVTVIHRVEHQLPIFVITFKRARRKLGPPIPLPIRSPAPHPVLTAEHAKVVRAITKALKGMPPSALPDFLKQVCGLPGVAPMLQVIAATNAAVAALLPSLAHLAGPAMVAHQPAARKRGGSRAAAPAAAADPDDDEAATAE